MIARIEIRQATHTYASSVIRHTEIRLHRICNLAASKKLNNMAQFNVSRFD